MDMLNNLKRLLLVALLVLVAVLILLLILENPQRISLALFGWVTPELPVSLLLVLAFTLGVLIGLACNLWLLGRLRLRLARLRGELSRLHQRS